MGPPFDDISEADQILSPRRKLFRVGLVVLLVSAVIAIVLLINPDDPAPEETALSPSSTNASTPSQTATRAIAVATTSVSTDASSPGPALIQAADLPDGLMVLAIREAYYSQLFLFHPSQVPQTRITFGAWHDMAPALSPDGRRVAFSSNRNGFWDLYVIDLISGDTLQLTDTSDYEFGPTWSPDGRFLAYEANSQGNLDIYLLALDDSNAPIQVTDHSAADHSPSWSPQGREIAFVSTRSGEDEIWIVDLQGTENRLRNASQSKDSREAYPTWSPDGSQLAWSRWQAGLQQIVLWSPANAGSPVRALGSGSRPFWHPQGHIVLAELGTPDQEFLTAYHLSPMGQVALPLLSLDGSLEGASWGHTQMPNALPAALAAAAQAPAVILWKPEIEGETPIPGGRQELVELLNVEAPDPRLHDIADESFAALVDLTTQLLGWDFLTSLEQAFVPITDPLHPGMGNDWLYTGRAFSFNPAPLAAGWVRMVREDYGHQTYWRIYILTRFQDGSQGRPMYAQPWEISARFSGDPVAYEAGGATIAAPPEGYWLDFTELAREFGWEREPALASWRTFYQGARFNEFVFRMGLDWHTAMLELYPAEVLITPSPITPITPSITPTRTATPTPSNTPTITLTPAPSDTAPAATESQSPTP